MKKLILLFFTATFAFGAVLAQNQGLPIIDMHQHAMKSIWSNKLISIPPSDNNPDTWIKDIAELLPKTVAEMRKHNVVLGVVTQDDQEELDRWRAYAPGLFVPGFMFGDPIQTNISIYRKSLKNQRLGYVGEITTQYNGFAPDDSRLDPFFSLAEEFDVPVLIHCAGIAGASDLFNIKDGNPLLLESVLKKHPTLRLQIENASFPYAQEIIALMYRYPNVYADLSTITWIIPRTAFYDHLKKLVDAGLANRLMFGSDQMIWPETIGMGIEAIESAEFLTQEQKRDIFYNNAARFLRLSNEEIKAHHRITSLK